jgi:uncharacterized protein
MGNIFTKIAFTPAVAMEQERNGSRNSYARLESRDSYNSKFGANEVEFISQRDSFYMATVNETGWPYVQHRGGPTGFVRVLNDQTIGFADFAGNRQYISVGNLHGNDRVSLFFMDYPNRTRLKLLGRARTIGLDDIELLEKLRVEGYRARVERGIIITLEGFDWNCSQHITPRFTEMQVHAAVQPLRDRIAELETHLASMSANKRHRLRCSVPAFDGWGLD